MSPREEPASYALDPFGPTANPAAYVPNEASERARHAMEAALEANRSTAVIGPPGHGKTLLLHLIGDRQQERSRVAYLAFASLGVDEFFAVALEALGRSAGESPRDEFGALVVELGPRGGVTLLVDDAHSMQPETAEALALIHRASHGDLRLVFAALDGDDSFRVFELFGDGVDVVSLHGSLSPAEARSYLESRLAYAGARPELMALFDDARVAELHRASEGVPRQLSHAAQELLRREAPGPMPQLRDLSSAPEPEPEGQPALSLSVLAERVLSGENAYSRLPEPVRLPGDEGGEPVGEGASVEATAEPTEDERGPERAPAAREAAPPVEPPPAPAPPEPEPVSPKPAPETEPVSPEPAPGTEPVSPEPAPGTETPARAEVSTDAAWTPPPPLESFRTPAVEETAPAREPDAEPPGQARGAETYTTILEPDPPPADPGPEHREPLKLPPRPPQRQMRPMGPRRQQTAPPEGAYRMARDPEAAARRARAAAEFAEPAAAAPVDPAPAPGFEDVEPRSTLWSRQTLISVSRWMAFGAGVGLAVMWWAGRGADEIAEPPRAPERAAVAAERAPAPAEPLAPPPAATTAGDLEGTEHDLLEPASPPVAGADPFRRPTAAEREAAAAAAPALPRVSADSVPVSINATPWATIQVDGVPIGETPLAGIPLAPGPHVFRATLPDGSVREQTVEISPDNRAVSFR